MCPAVRTGIVSSDDVLMRPAGGMFTESSELFHRSITGRSQHSVESSHQVFMPEGKT